MMYPPISRASSATMSGNKLSLMQTFGSECNKMCLYLFFLRIFFFPHEMGAIDQKNKYWGLVS